MTVQPNSLQALIDEIDGVLSKASPQLPWVMAGDVDQQRRLLKQTRSYLVSLQEQASQEPVKQVEAPTNSPVHPSATNGTPTIDAAQPAMPLQGGYGRSPLPAESAQQVLQSVLQEMSYLRASIMQPMRMDIESLRQERETLLQEVRQLESQRQSGTVTNSSNQQQLITDFLQALMGRMQETLSAQVGQMLNNAQVMALQERSLSSTGLEGWALSTEAGLSPLQRLERLQTLQTQSDQLLLKLDSTLKVFFESLQHNVHSYQDSLNEELSKMHTLGQQGEAVMSGLISRLVQQLGREASNYLQTAAALAPAPAPLPPPYPTTASSTPHTFDDPITVLQPDSMDDEQSVSDQQIEQLLEELRDYEEVPEPTSPLPEPSAPVTLPQEADLGDLDLLNLELDGLDLQNDTTAADFLSDMGDMTLLQADQPEAIAPFQLDDTDLTFLQADEEPEQPDAAPPETPRGITIANLDAAVDFLNQLNLTPTSSPNPSNPVDPLQSQTPSQPEAGAPDEIDDFYESLFGSGAVEAADPFAEGLAEARSIAPAVPSAPPAFAADMFAADVEVEMPSSPLESEALSALESNLFDGFADPAQQNFLEEYFNPTTAPSVADFAADLGTEVTQDSNSPISAEGSDQFLFGEAAPVTAPPPPFSLPGEADPFLDWEAAPGSAEPSDPTVAFSSPAPEVTPAAEPDLFDEDVFERASPDEDLMPLEVPASNRLDVEVDGWTLEQLQQDLTVFEKSDEEDLTQLALDAIAPSATRVEIEVDPEVDPQMGRGTAEVVQLFPTTVSLRSRKDNTEFAGADAASAGFASVESASAESASAEFANTDLQEPNWLFDSSASEQVSAPPVAPPPPATPTEPLPPEPLAAASGVTAALPDDFLAALLGDAPIATDVTPPALDVQAVVTEPVDASSAASEDPFADFTAPLTPSPNKPSPLSEQVTLDLSYPEMQSSLTGDLFADLPDPRPDNEMAPPALPAQPAAERSHPSRRETLPVRRDRPTPASPASEDPTILTLSDLFNTSASTSAPASTPPTQPQTEPAPTTTLEDLIASMSPAAKPPEPSSAPTTPAAIAPNFTLEGLDNLFEELPSLQQSTPPASPELSADDFDATLENLFGGDSGSQASLGLYDQRDSDAAQKKRPNL